MVHRLNDTFAGFHALRQNRTCPEKPNYLSFIELIPNFGITPDRNFDKTLVLAMEK